MSRQFILSGEVDVIINVVDASALERKPLPDLAAAGAGQAGWVMALNMMDIVEKRGMEIDLHRLPEMLGIPVIPVSARQRRGLDALLHAAAHHKDSTGPDTPGAPAQDRLPITGTDHHAEYTMVYSDPIEDKIDQIIPALHARYPGLTNERWHALKLAWRGTRRSARNTRWTCPRCWTAAMSRTSSTRNTTSSGRSWTRC